MNGVHGLSGWRWLFIFDGVITLPMALWGTNYLVPDVYVLNNPFLLTPFSLLCTAGFAIQHSSEVAQARREEVLSKSDAGSRSRFRGTFYSSWIEKSDSKVAFLGLYNLLHVSSP